MARLDITDLSKRYGGQWAVENVTLDVPQGEFLVLLGPSGCGKTTTLRMIAGFVQPSGGAIRIGPRDVTDLPPWKRNTGMVFQSYALFPHMSVAANVGFGLEMRKVPKAEIAPRVAEALRLVRLDRYSERYPRELSGGQQQRVALARALAIRPDVLLLDEPLSNLDAKLREEVRIEIRELQQRLGLTTVMVTHDQEEALTVADRLVVMAEGRVRQIGTQQDLYERPADRFVASFVGRSTFLEGEARPFPQRGRARPRLRRQRARRLGARAQARTARHRAGGGDRQPPARPRRDPVLSRPDDRSPCAALARRPRRGSPAEPAGCSDAEGRGRGSGRMGTGCRHAVCRSGVTWR
jgi:ABC-type Fe3+/spermidine/putrescine transport system ATPase subunit